MEDSRAEENYEGTRARYRPPPVYLRCSCSASKNRSAKSTLAMFLLHSRAPAKMYGFETRKCVLYRVTKENRCNGVVVVSISFFAGVEKGGCTELRSVAFEIRRRRHLPLPVCLRVLPPLLSKERSLAKYVARGILPDIALLHGRINVR